MKKVIFIIAISICAYKVSAQETDFNPEERFMTFDKEALSAWTVEVGQDHKEIRDSFKKFCKDKYDIKVKSVGKTDFIAKQVTIKGLIAQQGDLKAALHYESGRNFIEVAFSLSDKEAINSRDYPTEMSQLKIFATNFAAYYNTNYYTEFITKNDKRIKELNAGLKSNNKEISSLNKKVKATDKKILKETQSDKKFELSNENAQQRNKINTLRETEYKINDELKSLRQENEDAKTALVKLEKFNR